MTNIELNELAPDFEITDYTGELFRLSDFKGKKNLFIVFNRGFV